MNIRSITAVLVGTSVLAFDCAPALAQDVGPISGERMSGIAKVLASDEFEGRAPGTPGETRTVEYLVAQFKALGLEPGGEAGSWTQAVPLVRTQVPDDARMSVTVAGVKLPLVQHENVEALSLRPVDRVADRSCATRVRRLWRLGAGARLGRLQGRST